MIRQLFAVRCLQALPALMNVTDKIDTCVFQYCTKRRTHPCAFYYAQNPHNYFTVSTNYYTLFFLFFKCFWTLNRLKTIFSAL